MNISRNIVSVYVSLTEVKKLIRFLIIGGISFFLVFAFSNNVKAETKKNYEFGVFPYLPAERIQKIWDHLAVEISNNLNVNFQLRTRPSYAQFRDEVMREKFDFVFIQPFVYAREGAANGYIPLVRFVSTLDKKKKGMLKAIIVSLEDSPYKSIEDLRGKVIAMPPATAAVSILGVTHFSEKGLELKKDYHISNRLNHLSCLQQLVIQKAQACVTAMPPAKRFEQETGIKLHLIDKTRPIPSSVIAVHKRIPKEEYELVRKVLLNLDKSDHGRKFLKESKLSGFIMTKDSDYDVVRKIWENTHEK